MTLKGYDPLNFGQVRLAKSAADGGDNSPDDVLFSGSGASAASGPALVENDTSWDPPANMDATELGRGFDFDTEILGEAGGKGRGAAPAKTAAAARTAPAKTITPAKAATSMDRGMDQKADADAARDRGRDPQKSSTRTSSVRRLDSLAEAAASDGLSSPSSTQRPSEIQRAGLARPVKSSAPFVQPPVPGPSAMAIVTPVAVVVAGAGVASWLHFMQHNSVMAAIAAGISLGLAGMSWFALRR